MKSRHKLLRLADLNKQQMVSGRKATVQLSISAQGQILLVGDDWAQDQLLVACEAHGLTIEITRTGHCG